MVVYRPVASGATAQQALHLCCQHVAHAHGVGLYQVGEGRAELTHQVGMVLLHLPCEVLAGEQRVEGHVCRRVNIGGQVFGEIVDGIGHKLVVDAVENVADGMAHAVAHRQRIDKGIAHLRQLLTAVGRRCLQLEEQESLVLDFQVGKGQFGAAVLVLRRRHELVDVFL